MGMAQHILELLRPWTTWSRKRCWCTMVLDTNPSCWCIVHKWGDANEWCWSYWQILKSSGSKFCCQVQQLPYNLRKMLHSFCSLMRDNFSNSCAGKQNFAYSGEISHNLPTRMIIARLSQELKWPQVSEEHLMVSLELFVLGQEWMFTSFPGCTLRFPDLTLCLQLALYGL